MSRSTLRHIIEPPHLPSNLLEEVLDLLNVTDEEVRAEAAQRMREAAEDFGADRAAEPYWGKPKKQRLALRKLRRSVQQMLMDMEPVAAEYAVSLDWFVDPERRTAGGIFKATRQSVEALEQVLEDFDRAYRPVRGAATDISLEQAVGQLREIVVSLSGREPRVQLNKHSGGEPKLSSNEARVIGTLLQSVDPELEERTIANMLVKVRDQRYRTESHLGPLMRITLEAELDGSLLPARRGD